MATARQLVRSFMSGIRPERPPVLPVAFYHAARLDGAAFDEVASDATRLSRALLQQRDLLGGDCITVRFDETWFGEAAGLPLTWSGGLPRIDWDAAWPLPLPGVGDGSGATVFDLLLDVIDRLCQQLRRAAPVMATLPGPLTLGARTGDIAAAGAVVRTLAERCCRAGAELVMLQEPADAPAAEIASAGAPILNTIRYFNAFPILHGPRVPEPELPEPTLFPADAAPRLPEGRRAGLVVPDDCIADAARAGAFAAALSCGPQPIFFAVFDEALLPQSVEVNTAALRALQGPAA